MNIGEKIRARRKSLGMTQVELSKKAGIKQATVSALENGINKPAADTLALLASALDCSVSELFGDAEADVTAPANNGQRELLELYFSLNEEGRERLIEQARDMAQLPRWTKKREATAG